MIKEILMADANDKGCIVKKVLPHSLVNKLNIDFKPITRPEVIRSNSEIDTYFYHHEVTSEVYLGKNNIIEESVTVTFEGSNRNYIYDSIGCFGIVSEPTSPYEVVGVSDLFYTVSINEKGVVKLLKKYKSVDRKPFIEKVTITYETEDMDRTVVRVKDVIKSETELYKYKFYRPYKVETEI